MVERDGRVGVESVQETVDGVGFGEEGRGRRRRRGGRRRRLIGRVFFCCLLLGGAAHFLGFGVGWGRKGRSCACGGGRVGVGVRDWLGE